MGVTLYEQFQIKIDQITKYLMEVNFEIFNRKWTAVRIGWTRFTVVKMSHHSVKNQRKFKTREFKVSIKRFSNFYITRQIAASYWSKYVTWSSGLKLESYMEPSLVALYKMDSKNVPI